MGVTENRTATTDHTVDRADNIDDLVRLADAADGCLTVHQIRDCGYTKKQIRTMTQRGILRRVLIGVYVLARGALTHRQVVRVALLAAGPSAHVAGRTALELRGAAKPHRTGHFWIGVVGGQRRPLRFTRVPLDSTGRAAVIHFVRAAPPVRVDTIDDFAVASAARALVDTAARESASMTKKIVWEADFREILDEEDLAEEFDRGRRGTRALQSALPPGPLVTALKGGPDSRAAHRLLRGLLARGIEPSSIDQPLRIGDFEARPDFLFVRQGLVVEADGPQHDLPERKRQDEVRDATLAAAGLETLRIKTERIRRALDDCVNDVIDALHRRALA